MKRPLSVVIISKNPSTLREVEVRYDAETSFPRLRLISILLRALVTATF